MIYIFFIMIKIFFESGLVEGVIRTFRIVCREALRGSFRFQLLGLVVEAFR